MNALIHSITLFLCCFLFLSIQAEVPANRPNSQEEALSVRRILEFWKDQDYPLAKNQIYKFLKAYPNSQYTDSLLAILAEVFRKEGKPDDALQILISIQDESIKKKTYASRLDCLHRLGRFEELKIELGKRLKQASHVEKTELATWKFYYAEALHHLGKTCQESQERFRLLNSAINYYEELKTSEQRINALNALSEIYGLLQNYEQAAENLNMLASLVPDFRDHYLLLQASMQAKFNSDLALATLAKVQKTYGPVSSDAALSRLALLYELGKYKEIIHEKETYRQSLKQSQSYFLNYFLAKSYFQLGEQHQVLQIVRPFLNFEMPYLKPEIDKELFWLAGSAAFQLRDLTALNEIKQTCQRKFPAEEISIKLVCMQAALLKLVHLPEEALLLLNQQDSAHELLVFEKAKILFEMEKWHESALEFDRLIKRADNALIREQALQYKPQATTKILEGAAEEERLKWQNQLIADIDLALDSLPEPLLANYWLKKALIYFELEQYDSSIEVLFNSDLFNQKNEYLHRAFFLIALSFHRLKNWEAFINFAEKALSLGIDNEESNNLRLNLFSSYISLSKDNEKQRGILLEKAAETLAYLKTNGFKDIQESNKLWLANFYYHKAKINAEEYLPEPVANVQTIEFCKKATEIFYEILPGWQTFQIKEENRHIEQELFKLGNLFAWQGMLNEQHLLLENLVEQQKIKRAWEWHLPKRSLLSLAHAKEKLHRLKGAESLYFQLSEDASCDFYVRSLAKYKWATLAFKLLKESEKNMDNEKMLAILKALKDLQIYRVLAYEPLHLKAAVNYVKFRSSIEKKEKQAAVERMLLARLLKKYSEQDDLWSKSYHESRKTCEAKNEIYQAYMQWIEARHAELENQNNKAICLYKSFLANRVEVLPEMTEHAEKQALNQVPKDD